LTSTVVVLGLMLPGCGTEQATEADPPSSSSASSSAAADTSAVASVPGQTIAEYLQAAGITQTLVKRGDPGIPTLNLPIPAGWRDVGANAPQDAFGAIYLADPAVADDPPAIIARMARLSGDVDQAKILELAPNAILTQPGYRGPETGRAGELSGFDAVEIAGTVDQNGQPEFVARKTVVIPGQDGIYLLALDAQGAPEQRPALMEAMSVIDAETTIEP
jgi:hypothetical protein